MSIYTDGHLKKFNLKFIILKSLQCDEFISECIYSFFDYSKSLILANFIHCKGFRNFLLY